MKPESIEYLNEIKGMALKTLSSRNEYTMPLWRVIECINGVLLLEGHTKEILDFAKSSFKQVVQWREGMK